MHSRSTLTQFLLLCLVWGSSFLFIRIALEGLSFGQVALGRLLLGSVTLIIVGALARQPWPRGRIILGHLAMVAVLLCVLPFVLISWAEQHIPSGLASIYNATTPLMTLFASAVLIPSERMTRARTGGLLLGFCGVFIVLAPWQGLASAGLWAQSACLLATASYGLGYTYFRRHITPLGLSALTVARSQILLATAIMLVLAPFMAASPAHLSAPVILSIVALGALGTGPAYIWNTNVIRAWGAASASTVTYVAPLVGVILGVIFLDESLSWTQPLGGILVVIGILVSQARVKPSPRRHS